MTKARRDMKDNQQREQLAEHQHDTWSDWMKWMFSRGTITDEDGVWVMPADLVIRWQRQMDTAYDQLPDHEKINDRKIADEIIKLFDG